MPKLNNQQDEHTTTGVPIDEQGEIARAHIPGDRVTSINIQADGDASYAVDVAAGQESDERTPAEWFQGEVEYLQSEVDDPQDIRDAFVLGDRHLRVRVVDPAAAGSTATVTIQVA